MRKLENVGHTRRAVFHAPVSKNAPGFNAYTWSAAESTGWKWDHTMLCPTTEDVEREARVWIEASGSDVCDGTGACCIY